jgi:glycosyltransferase involved in cell wall biosynthesis
MAGAGDEPRRHMERIIQDWGLSHQLRLIGVRKDAPRLMRAADTLFFPSRQEGLGMVAVEAQAACLPVLASTAVPREAIVIPEIYAALPLSDPVECWADALLATLAKPRLAWGAARAAVEASAFSIQNSVARLEAIYRGVRA